MRGRVVIFLLLLTGGRIWGQTGTSGSVPDLSAGLEMGWQHPPAAARPWVFWYWMDAAVSKRGIRADLADMKKAGIGGAYLLAVSDTVNPPFYTSVVRQQSPVWREMVRYAMKEADRRGLQVAMHACDGVASAKTKELRLSWDEYPGRLKPLQDLNYSLGINRMVFHVTYNPRMDRKPGMTFGGVGNFFQRDQIWWGPGKAWIDYTQRCQWLLQQGKPVADHVVWGGAFKDEGKGGMVLEKDLIATESDTHWAAASGSDTSSEIIIPALHQATGVVYAHRTAPGLDIYFVSNQLDTSRIINLSLRVSGRKPELWDAVTGEITRPEQWSQHRKRTVLPVRLEGNGSVFVVLRKPIGRKGLHADDNNTLVPDNGMLATDNGTLATDNDTLVTDNGTLASDNDTLVTDNGTLASANSIALFPVQTLGPSWSVHFDMAGGGPLAPVVFDSLQDWSRSADSSIRYYSGTAIYTQTFEWDLTASGHDGQGQAGPDQTGTGQSSRLWLDLGQVDNIARVTLNGIDCGIAWTPPYRVEISKAIKPGNNMLNIEVTNSWANRLTGDHSLPENKRITRSTAPYHLDGKLLPAGLLGPVKIVR